MTLIETLIETLAKVPLIRGLLARLRPRRPAGGPPGEGAWARQLRQACDRTRLAGLDDRLLRDMGLRREVSVSGLDFVPLSSADPAATAKLAPASGDCRTLSGAGPAATSSQRHGAIDRP
ncbi:MULTISPECIES: DUF1127 domain-containing protein [Methylobacterium]|uniref:DUF1127 domain-containing protein n=1 Tax=Methylobacterium TaxID=407 RepID=UPI0013ED2F47|nr:DUF1127 domain-containing protein [Methylobacterium sp. DB0501]NGM34645.1 hypothetical protein [Methylobacterium sp. DB0501]